MIYAVFKESTCRHECGGVYSTPEKACDAARLLIEQECDDHHWYQVVPFVLDEVPQMLNVEDDPEGPGYRWLNDRWTEVVERPTLVTFERINGVVHQRKGGLHEPRNQA